MPVAGRLHAPLEAGLMVKTPDTRNKPWSLRVVHLPGASPATRFREDDMNQTTRRVFGVAGFALLLAASASFAQQPSPVRVRGTVEAVDGPVLTVKSRDGQTIYKVAVADNVAVRGIIKAAITDIK